MKKGNGHHRYDTTLHMVVSGQLSKTVAMWINVELTAFSVSSDGDVQTKALVSGP